MSEDREPCGVLDCGAEIPWLGPGWMITLTHEGDMGVSMALPDQTKQRRRMKLVGMCRLCQIEDRKVLKMFTQRGVDDTEHGSIDSLINPHLL